MRTTRRRAAQVEAPGRPSRPVGKSVVGAVAAALALAGHAMAEQRTLTWNGGGWDGGWTSPGFPSNTPTQTYVLLIDGGKPASSAVTLFGVDPITGLPPTRVTVDGIVVDAGDTLKMENYPVLTILDQFTLNGNFSFGLTGGGALLLGNGRLAGTGTLTGSSGTVASTGGPFVIGRDIQVRGNGVSGFFTRLTVGNADAPLANEGRVVSDGGTAAVGYGTVLLTGSAFSNTGTIEATNGGVVAFGVPFQRVEDLGNIAATNGGRFRIAGTLDNTGRTFALGAATPDWELAGTVRGGRITTADGKILYVTGPAVLDDVTVDGSVRTDSNATLRLTRETLAGTGTLSVNNFSNVRSDAGRLVIGPGMTVTGSTGGHPFDYGLGDAGRPTVNQGRIVAESGSTLQVNGSTFSNEGDVEVRAGGTLSINSSFRLSDLGSHTHDGTIRITGTLENAGQTFSTTGPGQWELAGTVRGGAIETPGGTELVVPSDATARLDDARLNGTLRLDGFGVFPSNQKLILPAGQTLSGSGTVLLTGQFEQEIFGEGGTSIGEGITVRGNRGKIGQAGTPLVNAGTIRADVAGGSVTLAGATIRNSGTLSAANGGTLVVDVGAYTLANLGAVSAAGGTVRYRGTLDATGGVVESTDAAGAAQLWGKIRGGSLRTDATHPLDVVADSTLDHVTFAAGAVARMTNRTGTLTVDGPLSGEGEFRFTADLQSLRFAGASSAIGPGMAVRNETSLTRGTIGDPSRPLVNEGAIDAGFGLTTLDGSTLTNRGVLRAGRFGAVIARGPLAFEGGATLSAVVGFQPNPDAALRVTGALDLSGPDDVLDLSVDPALTRLEQPWLLATSARLDGVFDHVTPGFVLDYSRPGLVYVTAVPVPEPSGLAVAAFATAGLATRRRRKRNHHGTEKVH